MIGFFVKIAVFLVFGLLAYNYFFGSTEEKSQSSKVFGQMKDVAVSVGELAKSEKQKFEAGKYDEALENLGAAYQTARESAQKLDASLLKRISELEQRKTRLQKELASIEQADRDASLPAHDAKDAKAKAAANEKQQQRKATLQAELDKLQQDSDALLNKTK